MKKEKLTPKNSELIFVICDDQEPTVASVKDGAVVYSNLEFEQDVAPTGFRLDSDDASEYCGYLLDCYLENEFGTTLTDCANKINSESDIIFSDINNLANTKGHWYTNDFGCHTMIIDDCDNKPVYAKLYVLNKYSKEDMSMSSKLIDMICLEI